jgi:GDP-L-fucose synthase
MHVDDMADACFFLMQHYNEKQFVNVSSGEEVSIKQLAEMISTIVGFKGRIAWDQSKPDGTPRKFMDDSQLKNRGWKSRIHLQDGIRKEYEREFLTLRKD